MIASDPFELPADQQGVLKRARVLAWITIAFLVSSTALTYLVMGSSQAMKAAWAEDLLSIVPSLAFLISTRVALRPPNKLFPYGYHRATSLAFLCASLALLGMGGYLFIDSVLRLVAEEHPIIGSVEIMGRDLWFGWLMTGALIYSGIPPVFIGRIKIPLARSLHDKTLFADATMNKDDMLTAGAALTGVLGTGFGIWWVDAAAGALISLAIIKDGYSNLSEVAKDLSDRMPKTTDHQHFEEVPAKVREFFKGLPWVRDAGVRMREEGHVFYGEVFLVLRDETDVARRFQDAVQRAKAMDWRIHDLVVTPVLDIPDVNQTSSQ